MKFFYTFLLVSVLLSACSSDRANSEDVMSQVGEPVPETTLFNPAE